MNSNITFETLAKPTTLEYGVCPSCISAEVKVVFNLDHDKILLCHNNHFWVYKSPKPPWKLPESKSDDMLIVRKVETVETDYLVGREAVNAFADAVQRVDSSTVSAMVPHIMTLASGAAQVIKDKYGVDVPLANEEPMPMPPEVDDDK